MQNIRMLEIINSNLFSSPFICQILTKQMMTLHVKHHHPYIVWSKLRKVQGLFVGKLSKALFCIVILINKYDFP